MFTKGTISTYVEFSQRVAGSGWSKRLIRRKLLKQVDKADYVKSEVGQIVKYLGLRAQQEPVSVQGNLIGKIMPESLIREVAPQPSPYSVYA